MCFEHAGAGPVGTFFKTSPGAVSIDKRVSVYCSIASAMLLCLNVSIPTCLYTSSLASLVAPCVMTWFPNGWFLMKTTLSLGGSDSSKDLGKFGVLSKIVLTGFKSLTLVPYNKKQEGTQPKMFLYALDKLFHVFRGVRVNDINGQCIVAYEIL